MGGNQICSETRKKSCNIKLSIYSSIKLKRSRHKIPMQKNNRIFQKHNQQHIRLYAAIFARRLMR